MVSMNSTEARNWSTHLRSQHPAHAFAPVLLSEHVYRCPVTGAVRKLHTEGVWGVEMDGVPYSYPPTPERLSSWDETQKAEQR